MFHEYNNLQSNQNEIKFKKEIEDMNQIELL